MGDWIEAEEPSLVTSSIQALTGEALVSPSGRAEGVWAAGCEGRATIAVGNGELAALLDGAIRDHARVACAVRRAPKQYRQQAKLGPWGPAEGERWRSFESELKGRMFKVLALGTFPAPADRTFHIASLMAGLLQSQEEGRGHWLLLAPSSWLGFRSPVLATALKARSRAKVVLTHASYSEAPNAMVTSNSQNHHLTQIINEAQNLDSASSNITYRRRHHSIQDKQAHKQDRNVELFMWGPLFGFS